MSSEQVALLAVGTELAPEPNGRRRYVCRCGRVRTSIVAGLGFWRTVGYAVALPLIGLLLLAFLVAVMLGADYWWVRAIAVAALAAIAFFAVRSGTRGGHRGWCATRASAYHFVAIPAFLMGELASLP